jgi:hypothetical protein
MGALAAVGGAHSLLFRDPRYRAVTWTLLALVTAGWVAYFTAFRTAPVRVTLEVISVSALVAAALRVRRLMRVHGVVPPLYRPTSRFLGAVWPVLGSPGVLAGKVWLLAMLVMEWRGKAHFAPLEYVAVGAAIVGMAAWKVLAMRRARPFSALESYSGGATPPACPLGFGCQPVAPSRSVNASLGAASLPRTSVVVDEAETCAPAVGARR